MNRNLLLRVLSAALLLPLLVLLVLWDQRWGLATLALVATALALGEYAAMALKGRPARERWVVVLVGTALAVSVYMWPHAFLLSALAAVLLVASAQLAFARDIQSAGARLGLSLAGLFYVAPLMMSLPLLQRDLPQGESWVFLALGCTFICDTGAYFAGRALGRHKLAPTISPGKTWEGVYGGTAAAIGFAFLARATFFPQLSVASALAVGAGASVLAPAGDLVESLLKRATGVKDSGHLIPGHGGMLDRIDALLFVGSFVYLYARLLGV